MTTTTRYTAHYTNAHGVTTLAYAGSYDGALDTLDVLLDTGLDGGRLVVRDDTGVVYADTDA